MGDHMAEEPRTKMISMRFDIELMDRIKAIAEREDRTFAAQLQRMLRQWLDEHPVEPDEPKRKAPRR